MATHDPWMYKQCWKCCQCECAINSAEENKECPNGACAHNAVKNVELETITGLQKYRMRCLPAHQRMVWGLTRMGRERLEAGIRGSMQAMSELGLGLD